MRNRKRTWLLRRVVLGFAIVAVAAPVAQARVEVNHEGQLSSSVERLDIETVRASNGQTVSAGPDIEAIRAGRSVGTFGTVTARPDIEVIRSVRSFGTEGLEYPGLQGLKDRSVALNEKFAPSTEPVQVSGKADGFDWGDAGIGAGALLGAILLTGGAALATRRVGHAATA